MSWTAKNKTDLIIEVWEKLDCESIGATELESISTVVLDVYGKAAVDSPMVIARLLADEGAELRHSEIMELHLAFAADRPYDAAFRNILRLDGLESAASTIRDLENLRLKYKSDGDAEGLRLLRETAIRGKRDALEAETSDPIEASVNREIAEWFTIWLQTPEIFETWMDLRRRSPQYLKTFGPK